MRIFAFLTITDGSWPIPVVGKSCGLIYYYRSVKESRGMLGSGVIHLFGVHWGIPLWHPIVASHCGIPLWHPLLKI